jgi:antitoxin VapB
MVYASLEKDVRMSSVRTVKLFTNGRSQAVRIPREFELPGNTALLSKDGDRLIIEPAPAQSLLALLAQLQAIKEDFPVIDDPAPEPVRL